MVVTDPERYDAYLETVAQNWADYDPSPARTVAQVCVFGLKNMGSETAILTVSRPWHEERIAPTAVILGSDTEYLDRVLPTDPRDAAVDIFEHNLEQYIATNNIEPE